MDLLNTSHGVPTLLLIFEKKREERDTLGICQELWKLKNILNVIFFMNIFWE